MKDIRIDVDGQTRCWNCGSTALNPQRTFRAKFVLGFGSLLTKQKLRCMQCNEYNDTGNAKPWDGPEDKKFRKQWEDAGRPGLQSAATRSPLPPPPPPAT